MKQLFESATFKLTIWYLAVIMVISISFSGVLYGVSSRELDRQFSPTLSDNAIPYIQSDDFRHLLEENSQQSKANIIGNLILFNIVTLAIGGVASYFFAHQTLQPIREVMDRQGEFVSDASHELRTPMAIIQTETEVVLRDKQASKTKLREQLESNLVEIANLRSLSDRLLQLSSEGKIDVNEVSLEEVAIDAVNRIVSAAIARDISVDNNIGDIKVLANPESLADILVILLDNAIKYCPKKSVATLTAQKQGKHALVQVADNGPGIAPEDQVYIFDKFYRSDKARSKSSDAEGFGLGLPLAKKLSEKMNIRLSIESELGKGTEFTLRIPLSKASD